MADYHRDLEARMKAMVNGIKDSLHRPGDPAARKLIIDAQKVDDMAHSSRNFRSIESVINSMLVQLKKSQNGPVEQRVISQSNFSKFYRQLESIRNDIRRQSSY